MYGIFEPQAAWPSGSTRDDIFGWLTRMAQYHCVMACSARLPCSLPWRGHTVGLMFALSRKKFVGSYVFFRATKRSYFAAPYAAWTRSTPTSDS